MMSFNIFLILCLDPVLKNTKTGPGDGPAQYRLGVKAFGYTCFNIKSRDRTNQGQI